MPAVVVTGARQTGKSTLAQELMPGGRRFLSLDDRDVVDAARRDPEALLGGSQQVTLDEVQREPDLLHAVKRAIDQQRQPGKFLITGSANLLLMRQVSESLAGRASYLTLWPMTRREQLGLGRGGHLPQSASRASPGWGCPGRTARRMGHRPTLHDTCGQQHRRSSTRGGSREGSGIDVFNRMALSLTPLYGT